MLKKIAGFFQPSSMPPKKPKPEDSETELKDMSSLPPPAPPVTISSFHRPRNYVPGNHRF